MSICTYNLELVPDESVFKHWKTLLVLSKKAYDDCCDFVKRNNVPLNICEVHNAVYGWMRDKYPQIPAQGIIKVYKDALAALRSIKSNKHEGANTPERHALCMRLDRRLYGRLSRDGITMSNGQPNKRVLVPFKMYEKAARMFAEHPCGDPLLFFRGDRMFISVPFAVADKPVNSDEAVGVDLGMRQFFVTSEGKSFTDKTFLKNRRRLRYNRRQLQSKGTKAARRKSRKTKRHERNLVKDFCHRAANALLSSTEAGVVVLEEMKGIKGKTSKTTSGFKRKSHNRRMAQSPFAMFREIVSHKAPRFGKSAETVSPTYTSQTDSRTGRRDGRRAGRRYYCKDGLVLDADWNAAVNIALRSKHPVSSARTPLDGALAPLAGMVKSTTPKHVNPHLVWSCKPSTL